jgi:hypothetical protein
MKSRISRKRTKKHDENLSLSPPPFNARAVRKFRIRCLATAPQIDAPVRYLDLAALLGIIATSAITSVHMVTAFRMTKVRIWSPSPFGSVSTSNVSITWDETAADFVTPPISRSDSSVNPNKPAFVDARPPRGSLADKWHSPGQTDGICIMTYPTGSIVDFHFEFVLDDAGGPLAGPAIIGGVTGTIYHRSFNSLLPQSVNGL